MEPGELEWSEPVGVSGVLVASCISVGVAELAGWIETNLPHELSASDVLFQAILILAVAVLVALMSRALRESIVRAHLTHQSYQEIFNASGEGIIVHDAAFTREAFEAQLSRTGPSPTRFEWCAIHREGRPVWLDVTVRSAVVGGRERVVSVLRDTSERRALEEQVQQAEKLRAVGQLARGVAHDFNNQLTVILANASLLEAEVAHEPELAEYTESIVQSSRRSAELTQQLLAFARKGQRREELVDLDELVAEVKLLLGRSIDKRIEVVHERAAEPAATRGDSTFLQSALLNLGLNARDAMPHGGTLRFAVEVVDAASGGRTIRLRVEDTGCGMSKEVQAHVFEPFFTTKEAGNGMGLAAVYGTVVAHEGTIEVESRPGHGTRFTIELPHAAAAGPPSSAGPSEASGPRFEGVHVLLAEDEPGVARVATRILRSLGCLVTHCADGEAALAALREGDFDVALLDHSMPRMTGAEALAAARELGCTLPVVAMSGYRESSGSPRHRPDAFVAKPFTRSALADALESVLKPAAR